MQKNATYCLLTFFLCSCSGLPGMPDVHPPFQNFLSKLENPFTRTYDTKWWEGLNDPAINTLVEKTLDANPTLEQALAQLDEAKAQVGVAKSYNLPTLGVGASAGPNFDGNAPTGQHNFATSVGPTLVWEVDLFGRIRNSSKAAKSRLDARTADAQNVRVILASDVAVGVTDLRACRYASLVIGNDVVSLKETLGLVQKKVQAGFSARIDEDSTKRDLATAIINLATQNEQCEKTTNALVALTGMEKRALQTLVAESKLAEIGMAMPEPPYFPAEVEATALMNHPNVQAAAYEAQAAWAEISVARAERLPKLELSSLLTGQWIRAGGSTLDFATWSVTAGLTGTVFDGGRGAAYVDAAEARYRKSLAVLEGALRVAVQETQDALASQQSAHDRLDAAAIALQSAISAFSANEARWKNGSISLLELEDSRRQLSVAQIDNLTAKRDRAAAWIALYRVLGAPIALRGVTDV